MDEVFVLACGEDVVCKSDWRHVNLQQPLSRSESDLAVRAEEIGSSLANTRGPE